MSKKIVIVESDTAFSKKLRDELAKSSFNVVETADGKGAYDLVRREKPDLVVLAVELAQGQSGYLVCGKLKKDDEFKKIPVIIIGKDPEGFEGHKKLKTRAEEYLKKPFDPAALTVKVGVLIGLPNDKPAEDDVVVDDLNLDSLDDPSHPSPMQAEAPKPAAEEHLDFDSMFNSATESQPGGALQAEAPPLGATDVLGDPLASAIPADLVPGEVVSGVDIDVREDSIRNAPGHAAAPAEVDLDISLEAAPPKPATRPQARPPSMVADGEVVSLRGKVSELEEKITLLENQVSERDAELAAARSAGGGAKDTSALKEQLLKKDKDLLKLRAELNEKSKELNEKETELLELKEKEAGFESQVSDLTAEQAKRDSQIKALTQRSDLLTAEKKKSDAAIAAAKDEARATATQLSTAQGELDLANEQLADLNRQIDGLRQQAEATTREFANTRSGLDAEIAGLRTQLATVQTDLEQAKADHSALRSEHDTRLRAHTEEAETMKARIAELDSNNARNEERVVKAYQKIKNDEKLRDKTRKALSVALQLLDENAAANVVDETELRPT